MTKLDISELRGSYTKYGLIEAALPLNPLSLLRSWIEQAVHARVPEPNAMSLATAGPDGMPDVRMVLLKEISKDTLSFYTNYRSGKAADIETNPLVSCCFWWPELERQVRLRGSAAKVSGKESADYFATRPRESQIGAWASEQSSVVAGREELEKRFEACQKRFAGKDVPLPDTWGGYRIRVSEIEFWQGRPGRMHDRILYAEKSGEWVKQRLAP